MHWQSSGDYLLVRVDRTKTKTTNVTSFEVLRMREKDIPIDVTELKVTEDLQAVSWEPKGNHFVLLVKEKQNTFAYFYEVQTKHSGSAVIETKALKHVEARGINSVHWSPKGRFCVLAGLRASGSLQFWDVKEQTLMSSAEHYMASDLEWDPTGRYVVSSISFWRSQTDTGLIVWSLSGEELSKQNIPEFKMLRWRPCPPSLLPASKQKEIRKNLKSYAKEFEEEDAMESNKASAEVQAKRRAQLTEYKAFLARMEANVSAQKAELVALLGYDPATHLAAQAEEVVHIVDEVLKEVEEIIE